MWMKWKSFWDLRSSEILRSLERSYYCRLRKILEEKSSYLRRGITWNHVKRGLLSI